MDVDQCALDVPMPQQILDVEYAPGPEVLGGAVPVPEVVEPDLEELGVALPGGLGQGSHVLQSFEKLAGGGPGKICGWPGGLEPNTERLKTI